MCCCPSSAWSLPGHLQPHPEHHHKDRGYSLHPGSPSEALGSVMAEIPGGHSVMLTAGRGAEVP